jgi:quercetin dioxygenase-like cupin family protein
MHTVMAGRAHPPAYDASSQREQERRFPMTDLISLTTQVPLQNLRDGLNKRPIVETPNVRVGEFFFDQGISTKGHTHDVEQAAYIVAGKFQIDLNGQVVEVGPGDGYSIPANCQHSVVCTETGSYVLTSVLGTAQDAHGHDHGHGHSHDH